MAVPDQATIGATTVQMGSNTVPFYAGCQLIAHPSNTGIVYYGYSASVTTATGMPLAAGAGVTINPQQNKSPATVYFIASASSQTICFDIQ